MKVRKLAVALALAGGLGSGVAQALGLGEIELQSYLNQPLNAEIGVNRLDGVSPDEIVVNLASERDYERVGLRREFFLTQLDFDVTTASNGELVIAVTSDEPVREPYLNFLVEVTWPSGRVMREYSLLVDPPVYAEDSDDAEQQPVQSASSQQRSSEPRQQSRQSDEPPASEETASDSSGPRTLGPVQASDTLWEIARSVRPDSSVSMQQVMLAIQDLNQGAFINGNINRLKRGEVLRVPDMDDIRARTQAEANREVAAQNSDFSQPQPEPEVDATETEVADQASGEGATGETASPDELRLVVPEDGDAEDRSEGSAGGDGRQEGSADAGDAVAMEELDRAERENAELNSRLEDMQDQVKTLERLIELKDSQLAEMQRNQGEEVEPAEGAPEGGSDEESGDAAEDEAPVTTTEGDATGEDSQEEDAPADEAVGESEDEESVTAEDDMAGEDAEAAGDEQAAPEQGADDAPSDDAAATTGDQPESDQAQPDTAEQEEQDKSFLTSTIELIAGNFMYQIALGGFLVLLLLLVLLISRRRANNENEFYQQLNDETEDDGFELDLGEEDAAASATALEEADRYVTYGQHDAAAEVLENAISREPSRSDLRLKLLAVYADTGNRAAFDKQYAELEAMELDDAQPEADALRARLEDVESTPSMDELESQLRGGDNYSGDQTRNESDDLMAAYEDLDLPEEEPGTADEADQEDPEQGIEYDFTGLDTTPEEDREEEPSPQPETTDDDGLGDIDFELPEEETRVTPDDEEEPLDLEDDFSSLELDEAGIDSEPAAEDVEGAADPVEEDDLDFGDLDLDSGPATDEPVDKSATPEEEAELDESFLDELDAELDKVASEENDDSDGLDDLELDVSDEDLALMDQASETEPEPDDESQLDLGDLDEPDQSGDDEVDDLSDLEIPELDSEAGADETEAPTEQVERKGGSAGIDDIDEASLGDDDDFDFLSGTDEVATKLDLARAYVDMGDSEGAREILEEVILEGSDEQKSDAQSLLKKLP